MKLLNSTAAVLAAALTLGLLGCHDPAQADGSGPTPPPGGGERLRWAPPELVNPITINLGTGKTYNKLDDNRDYILKLPGVKKVGATDIVGGHNVVIIGGQITLEQTPDHSNAAPSRAIYLKDNTGTVHIEGVLIDASGGGMSDGIDISSPKSTVQIENVRVDGIFGFFDQFHADVIQTFGGVADLRVDKLTGYSAYQGLTIDNDLAPSGSAELSRINLVAIHDQVWGASNNSGAMLWLIHTSDCTQIFPITLSEVYVKPRNNQALDRAVWPRDQSPCGARMDGSGRALTFPNLPVKGRVLKGDPPGGDFVPAGVAGLNYVSPGYRHGGDDKDRDGDDRRDHR